MYDSAREEFEQLEVLREVYVLNICTDSSQFSLANLVVMFV